MLVYQGAAQQALWTGREPPVDIMLKAAEAAPAASRGRPRASTSKKKTPKVRTKPAAKRRRLAMG